MLKKKPHENKGKGARSVPFFAVGISDFAENLIKSYENEGKGRAKRTFIGALLQLLVVCGV